MKGLQLLTQIHGEKCWPAVDKLSPCEAACPLHMDVPSYVMAVAQGKFKDAFAVIRQTNPLPSICGRVCHHPCEAECNRTLVDSPIAIQWLKRLASDCELNNGAKRPRPVRRTKEGKVAIIGSGPAGLTAAYDLVRQGYGVTIYEALPVAGGMLALGIPEFVLPKDVLEAEIGYIKDLGVDIRTNTAIGNNLTLEDLSRRGFDAVLIATGAWKSARLPIPGADLGNIFYALPLLQKARLGEKMSLKGKVAVIGGGDVAMDAARLALRLGAKEVHVAFLESRKDMPGHSWEIEAAEKEGAKLHPSLAPQQFRAKDGGKVGAIDFKRVASTQLDKEGRISWTLREGSGNDYSLDVDAVIIAIGQSPDPSFAGDGGLDVSRRGTFVVDPDTMATNVLGIFAAGDAVRMPGTVVEAMAAGRKAAASVDRYLRGQNLKAKASSGEKEILRVKPETIPDFFVRKARWDMPTLSPADATRSFAEAKLGYTLWEGVEEAKRCLNCRMCANCVFERGQICFETGSRLL